MNIFLGFNRKIGHNVRDYLTYGGKILCLEFIKMIHLDFKISILYIDHLHNATWLILRVWK